PCPRPSASASSRPCAVSCGTSRVIIFPPPVLVTFPGPILSTCPQESIVGPPGAPPGASLGAETLNSVGFTPKFSS
ncbi:KRSC protein, partial [Origma solitaria]|nr:KRSC protein [Origma solitaria]